MWKKLQVSPSTAYHILKIISDNNILKQHAKGKIQSIFSCNTITTIKPVITMTGFIFCTDYQFMKAPNKMHYAIYSKDGN
ncbi:hypothetical protein DWX17_11770 [[Clostridium] innocuum]|nr:hypothetical protein DWX17_11770 [[Clostridium] innocuum]